jgi:hypothetical protein
MPRRILVVAIAAVALSAGVYAFTASNTVSASTAGSGSGAVSGYAATSVTYTLNATTPSTVDTIAFTLNPTSTSTVKVKAGTTIAWKVCSNSSGSVTCDYSSSPIALSDIDNITVVAVS